MQLVHNARLSPQGAYELKKWCIRLRGDGRSPIPHFHCKGPPEMNIQHINSEELRQYIQARHEKDYLLLDVRQPKEYTAGHIPGARLLPLPELGRRLNELPTSQPLVFYCHSGGRSLAAATLVKEEGFTQTLFNLSGGMLAWEGGHIAGEPQVRLFSGQTLAELFQTAISLEKGAQVFYQTVAASQAGQPLGPVFERLARAEETHAKTVYTFWQEVAPEHPPFEAHYQNLTADILEGGMSLAAALEHFNRLPAQACRRIIELALQIEYAAFDLYRNLAREPAEVVSQNAFMSLAQAEKAHIQTLIQAISECFEDGR